MNNLLITKENKKTKRFILVFLLFTIYVFITIEQPKLIRNIRV